MDNERIHEEHIAGDCFADHEFLLWVRGDVGVQQLAPGMTSRHHRQGSINGWT
jgi:hypothetical protein